MYIIAEQIILILISTFSLFFGFWVYLQEKKNKANQSFLLLSISILGWTVFAYLGSTATEISQANLWYRLNAAMVYLFLFSFYLFISYYTNKEIKFWEKMVLVVLFLVSLASIPTNLVIENTIIKEWGAEAIWGNLGTFYKVFAFVVALLILKNLYSYYLSTIASEKLKIIYLVIGTSLMVVGNIIFNVIFPMALDTVKYQHFGDFSAIFFLGFTAYAIVKRKLFEVKVVLTTLFIALIAVILSVDLFLTETLLGQGIKAGTLIIFLFFGYLLVRSVSREIEQREELERVSSRLATTNVRLEAAYRKLQSLDKAKSEFLSIASHQLRTPLTAIKGYLSMIMEGRYGEVSDKAKEKMGDVYQSSERLIKLVNDLLNLSRIETGKMQLEPKEERIEDLVAEIVKDMHIVAEEKGIHLNFERPSTPLPEVFIDYDKIRQVILNIVDNALKYTTEGGVDIEIKKEKDSVLVIISDTGEGMTEEECSKMFQSFSRGSAGTILHTEGAGIGLYVSKRFVDMHKGKVWVESEGKGKGSTFYIKLPV